MQNKLKTGRVNAIESAIDKIQKLANAENIPGFSIGIFYKHEKGFKSQIFPFGIQRLQSQKLISNNNRYAIGSLSKPITTYLIAKALEDLSIKQGFDTPLRNFDPQGGFADITLKQAFSHTSGLPPLKPLLHFLTEGPVANRAENLVHKMRQIAKDCPPQSNNFDYANPIFAVAAYLVSKAWMTKPSHLTTLDTAYSSLARKYLPALGMHHTEPFGDLSDTDAQGHEKDATGTTICLPWSAENWITTASPAGGILSSINDLLHFLQHECSSSGLNQHALINNRFHSIIRRSQDSHYGLGWVIRDHTPDSKNPLTEIFHFGAIRGYSSQMGFYPQYQCGYVLLCNQGKATEFINQAKHHLEMGLLRLVEAASTSIEGHYSNPLLGNFSITPKERHFLLRCENNAEDFTIEADLKNPYRYFFKTGPWAGPSSDRFVEFSPHLDTCWLQIDASYLFERNRLI
jgi:CubicO group peptidase (beta-lactamase class C family)